MCFELVKLETLTPFSLIGGSLIKQLVPLFEKSITVLDPCLGVTEACVEL